MGSILLRLVVVSILPFQRVEQVGSRGRSRWRSPVPYVQGNEHAAPAQPVSLVLARVEMPPLALTGTVARTGRSTLWTGQTGAGQITVYLAHLPRDLNAENVAIELTIMDDAGLENWPAGMLYELVNPHKTGHGLKLFTV